MKPVLLQAAASTALVALIFLCLLWESVISPIRPGGSLLMIKALPLLAPLFGVLRGKVYTYQWAPLLVLAYLSEGVVRAWAERGSSRGLAIAEIVLSMTFVALASTYVKAASRPAR